MRTTLAPIKKSTGILAGALACLLAFGHAEAQEGSGLLQQRLFKPGDTSERDRQLKMPATKFDWGPVPPGITLQAFGDPREADHVGHFLGSIRQPLPSPYDGQFADCEWSISVTRAPREKFDEMERGIAFLRGIPKGVPGRVDINTGEWMAFSGGEILQAYEDAVEAGTFFGLPGVRRIYSEGKRLYNMPVGVESRVILMIFWLEDRGREGILVDAQLNIPNLISPPPFDIGEERRRFEMFLETFRFPPSSGTGSTGGFGPVSVPGLGGIGVLPGPDSLVEALAGVVGPGLIAVILGILGRLPPTGATGGGFGPGGGGGGAHVLSDGRTYHDGQRYTFHDGLEYVMQDGQLHPIRSLQDGEVFIDPEGSERIWKGGQVWMTSDWARQEATSEGYRQQHAAGWAEESARLNPELVELNRQWDEKMKWLDNLHTMERGVLYAGEEMDVLRQRDGPGDFRGKIEELIGTFQETGEMDRDTYSRMQRIYGMARRGDILDASAAHTEAEIFGNTMREGMERMTHEIVRGADMEGNRSYKSMALRALANILTVGKAELIYTPANSVYTMKEGVERGDSTREILGQIGWDLAKGEGFGRVFGHGMQYAGKYAGQVAGKAAEVLARRFPEATRVLSEKARWMANEMTKQRRSPFAAKVQPPPNIPPKVSPGAGRVAKPAKPAPPTTPATGTQRRQSWVEAKKQGRSKVDAYEEAMQSGDPEQIRRAALDVQGDKQALWEINRRGDHLKRGMNQEMNNIYSNTDQATIQRLAKKYGVKPKDIEVYAPTNPTKNVKVGADRDITYRMRAKTGDVIPVGDPKNPAKMTYRKVKPGEVAWVDVSYSDAQSIYNEEFYKAAGGSVYAPDMNPAQFAEHMDQLVTNRLHAEAYGRYSGDLRTAINRPSRMFSDPQQVGQAMGYKADHWYQASSKIRGVDPGRAETFMAEGMRQTTKQYRNQVGRRAAVLRRANRRFPNGGYDVKLDPKLEKAVSIMSLPETHGVAPSTVEAMLQKMGYTPSQVSAEVGQIVEMMQKLRPTK